MNLLKEAIQKALHAMGLDLKLYRSSPHAALRRLLASRSIDLVLDVGANKGQYYRFVRTAGYEGRGLSFEPLSGPHADLVRNCRRDPRWEAAPRCAIGEARGVVDINVSANTRSSSILPMLSAHEAAAPESRYTGTERVEVRTLDEIAQEHLGPGPGRIFLKVDAQGYEKRVLEGASHLLDRVQAVQLELSIVPLYEGAPGFREMLDHMEALGFSLYWMRAGFTDPASGQMLQADAIFARNVA